MDKTAELEALLFQHGEPITKQYAANILGISEKACESLVKQYSGRLAEPGRGITLISSGEEIQLAVKKEASGITEKIMKDEMGQGLTPALLETLTIIAYLGPVSRSSVDYIRGVNSSMILRNAMVRGLVQRKRHKNAYLYSITTDFLKHLGLTNIKDLPDYEKNRESLQAMADYKP